MGSFTSSRLVRADARADDGLAAFPFIGNWQTRSEGGGGDGWKAEIGSLAARHGPQLSAETRCSTTTSARTGYSILALRAGTRSTGGHM